MGGVGEQGPGDTVYRVLPPFLTRYLHLLVDRPIQGDPVKLLESDHAHGVVVEQVISAEAEGEGGVEEAAELRRVRDTAVKRRRLHSWPNSRYATAQ